MPELQTLENTPPEKIVAVFNESFSDYIVPLSLTKQQFENKIKNDSLRLSFSAAAFEDDKPVGFILHGYNVVNGEKVVYNAGTGVIPTMRGNKITRQLYDYILPVLRSNGFCKVQLEVITDNQPAIKTYQQIGFHAARELNCYKGAVNITAHNNECKIQVLENYDWDTLQSFWDWKPSWQNSNTAVENLQNSNVSLGIYANEILVGYIIFNPLSKRVQQFGVNKKYRGKGLAKRLFHHIANAYGAEISVINIDDASHETAEFMRSIGLEPYVRQFEMEMRLI